MCYKLSESIKIEFEKHFNSQPLLIASPGRINLIGEHTDYNNGFVFPASIDKYIISAFSKSENGLTHIYSLDLNEYLVLDVNVLEKQEVGSWKNYILGVIDELHKRDSKPGNFNLVFGGNIPLGAGLSSSAALENSIVFGLNELFDLGLSKEEMIQVSMQAEHNFAGVKCGIMDQFSSMNGKKGQAIFLDCEDLSYELISLQLDKYQLLLVDTKVKHQLAASEYNKRKDECIEGLEVLKQKYEGLNSLRDVSLNQLLSQKHNLPEKIFQRCLFVIQENDRVIKAKSYIIEKNWINFGQLLFDSHHGLQHLYDVSCPELDFLVEEAKKNNTVIGSRMMGGGFGGCTLNLIRKDAVNEFSVDIVEKYKLKFNKAADVYEVNISNGTQILKQND